MADGANIIKGDQIINVYINGKKYEINRNYQVVDMCWLMSVGDIVQFEMKGKTNKFTIIIKAEDLKAIS